MQNFINFVKEAWLELKQVQWLTVPQMAASTWLVILLVIVLSLFIAGVDFLLKHIVSLFI